MAASSGNNSFFDSSLVFHYDEGDFVNSNFLQTTENILYTAGDSDLNNMVTWTNSGEWVALDNDTSVEPPRIPHVDTTGLKIMSGRTIVSGSQHIGCASFNGSASTTYTISVYFRQTRAGSNQPYFRTNVNNNSLGNFNYNGNTNASTWPENKWIRISCTATLQSNETGAYLSNYIGETNDKVYYFAPQVERKSVMTPFVKGFRSDGIYNIARTNSNGVAINIATPGDLIYDGTNFNDHPYLVLGDWVVKTGGGWTMEHIVYYNVVPAGYNNTTSPACFFGSDTISYNSWYWSVLENKLALWNISPGYWRYGSTILQAGRYYHVAITCNEAGTRYQFYLNGVAEGGDHQTNEWNADYSGLRVKTIAAGNSTNRRTLNGTQPMTKIYTRTLSPQEIYNNYLQYKTRYNL